MGDVKDFKKLSERQRNILNFMYDYMEENAFPLYVLGSLQRMMRCCAVMYVIMPIVSNVKRRQLEEKNTFVKKRIWKPLCNYRNIQHVLNVIQLLKSPLDVIT